jgi:hypothetical protein
MGRELSFIRYGSHAKLSPQVNLRVMGSIGDDGPPPHRNDLQPRTEATVFTQF